MKRSRVLVCSNTNLYNNRVAIDLLIHQQGNCESDSTCSEASSNSRMLS